MYFDNRKFINSVIKVYEGIKCFELYNKGNIAFSGEQLFRVSHDYSTGGSGILLFLIE